MITDLEMTKKSLLNPPSRGSAGVRVNVEIKMRQLIKGILHHLLTRLHYFMILFKPKSFHRGRV